MLIVLAVFLILFTIKSSGCNVAMKNLYTTYLEKIWPSETEILYCASIVLWFSQSNICSSNLYIEYHDRNEDFGKNFQLCQSIRIYVLNFKFLGQQLQLTCYFLKKDTKVSKNFEFSNLKFQALNSLPDLVETFGWFQWGPFQHLKFQIWKFKIFGNFSVLFQKTTCWENSKLHYILIIFILALLKYQKDLCSMYVPRGFVVLFFILC